MVPLSRYYVGSGNISSMCNLATSEHPSGSRLKEMWGRRLVLRRSFAERCHKVNSTYNPGFLGYLIPVAVIDLMIINGHLAMNLLNGERGSSAALVHGRPDDV